MHQFIVVCACTKTMIFINSKSIVDDIGHWFYINVYCFMQKLFDKTQHFKKIDEANLID